MPLAKLEQLITAGAYLQARREADRLRLEGSLSVEEQGKALRLACRACLGLKDYYAAAKLGEQAVQRAREAGDPETLGRAHFDLGCALTDIGDTYGAQENLEAFLALLPELSGVDRWVGRAHYNLAVIHRQRKQWHAALEALERAASQFEATGQPRELAQTSLDQAWCYLMMGATTLAAPYLTRMDELLQAHPDEGLAADLICSRALYHRLEGDLATSTRLCQEIFVPGRQGVTAHQLGEAAWIMGENALSLGRMEEATLFANLALDHAASDNWPSLMNLAGDLRRRIAAHTVAGA